ncbi:MAG: hypothetical protein R3C03_02785 [Pirellulaceae bacterium]
MSQADGSFQKAKHVVIFPYFCDEEVDRYCRIVDWLKANNVDLSGIEFLLAASPRTPPSTKLAKSVAQVAEFQQFQCPSQVFGYPQGPTAMFWDCMDYIAENYSGDGFSLWFESDMVFTKRDWVSRLERDWYGNANPLLLMGCFIPEVYKFRWLRQKKKILDPHINGGACYALDFARHMPPEARDGVFDMVVYEFAKAQNAAIATEQISFSTMSRVRRDVCDDRTCILHGFMQEKDAFVDAAMAPVSDRERKNQFLHPVQDQMEIMRRRLSVCFFRKGRKSVLESTLLAQHDLRKQPHGLNTIRRQAS